MKSCLLLVFFSISSQALVQGPEGSTRTRKPWVVDTALSSEKWPVPKMCLKYIPDVVYLLPVPPTNTEVMNQSIYELLST